MAVTTARNASDTPGMSSPKPKQRKHTQKSKQQNEARVTAVKNATAIDTTSTKTRKKKAKKASNRLADARARMYHDLIFDSAELVFGDHGYEGATMQGIADEAGVSLKTVYATYESKRDLFEQIMRERAQQIVEAMRSAISEAAAPLDQLARVVAAYTDFILAHRQWLRIHLRGRVAWAFRPTDEIVAESWSAARRMYTTLIEQGMHQGEFFEGDPEEVGILVQSIMQVQIARALEAGTKDPTEIEQVTMLHLRRLLCPR